VRYVLLPDRLRGRLRLLDRADRVRPAFVPTDPARVVPGPLGGAPAAIRAALLEAIELGDTGYVIEVVADQEGAIAMFRSLGFVPEALLTDHVRDHAGQVHDLMVLAHSVEDAWGGLQATGVAESV